MGDTALYFADLVGESGRVFTFEFSPDNLKILQRNRARNPSLATRIMVIEEALWDRSGEILRFQPDGPGATFERPDGEPHNLFSVTTVTLDDFEAPGPGGSISSSSMSRGPSSERCAARNEH